MTWFDGVILLLMVLAIWHEARQETGRALLDTFATFAAFHFAGRLAGPATQILGLGGSGGEYSTALYGLLFLVLWVLGLGISRLIHSETRWSMDQMDPLFGAALGLLMAVALGHVLTEVTAQVALTAHGGLPEYLEQSPVAEELRTFRTYHYVLDVFESYQRGR